MYKLISHDTIFRSLSELMIKEKPDILHISNEFTSVENTLSNPESVVYVKENIEFADLLKYSQGIYPYECTLSYLTSTFDPDSPLMCFARKTVISSIENINKTELVSNATKITKVIVNNIDSLRDSVSDDISDDMKYQLKLILLLRNNLVHETVKLKMFMGNI